MSGLQLTPEQYALIKEAKLSAGREGFNKEVTAIQAVALQHRPTYPHFPMNTVRLMVGEAYMKMYKGGV